MRKSGFVMLAILVVCTLLAWASAEEYVDPEVPEVEEFLIGGEEMPVEVEMLLGEESPSGEVGDGQGPEWDDPVSEVMAQPLPLYESSDPGEIVLYYLYEGLANRVPLPDGALTSYHIDAAPGAVFEVLNTSGLPDYERQPLFVAEDGYVFPQRSDAFVDNVADVIVKVTEGDASRELRFHILSYCFIYTDEVMNRYLSNEINDSMTDLEKVIQITKIAARDFDYGAGISDWQNMVAYGKGDCWASTGFILEACARLGISAEPRDARSDPGAGSGHVNALITLPRGSYIADAGYSGTKPRYWYVQNADASKNELYQKKWDPAAGQTADVFSAELDAARAVVDQEEVFEVVTAPGAKTLYMYDKGGALLARWENGSPSILEGEKRIWKPRYAFTAEGVHDLVFKAATEDGHIGVSAPLRVETYAPKCGMLSVKLDDPMPAIGADLKLTLETGPDALAVALVNEKGEMVYRWFGANENLYMERCDPNDRSGMSLYTRGGNGYYNALVGGKRVWTVKCSLWEMGTQRMTFYALADDSAMLDAGDYIAGGNALPVDITVVPMYVKSVSLKRSAVIGQPILFEVVTPNCTGELALYDENGNMLDSWDWADTRPGQGYVFSVVNNSREPFITWNVSCTSETAGNRTFTFKCKPVGKYMSNSALYDFGDGRSIDVNVSDHAHVEIWDDGVPATCLGEGRQGGSHCYICGLTLSEPQVIPALGHSPVTDAAVAPTCAVEGRTEGSHCGRCGAVIVPAQAIPVVAHTPVAVPGYPPTDISEGLTDGSQCAVCGEVLVAQESIPALVQAVELARRKSNGTITLAVGERRLLRPSFATDNGWVVKSYKSSKARVVSVDANGLIVANAEGKAKVTVRTDGKKVKATLTIKVVDPYKPTGVTIAQGKTIMVNKGETLQLTATLSPAAAQSGLTWKSSKRKVAMVDANGLVTPLAEGKAKITVTTRNKKKARITVKVVDPYKPTGVVIAQGKVVTMKAGETLQLEAGLTPATAQSALTWKSSKRKIATVDGSGVVTARKKGKAKITVMTYNRKKATITIKVVE